MSDTAQWKDTKELLSHQVGSIIECAYRRGRIDEWHENGRGVSIHELEDLYKEMSTIVYNTDKERDILWTCMAMIDELVESYKENMHSV